MKTCASCGEPKPNNAVKCPGCQAADMEIIRVMNSGTPSLTLLMVATVMFWLYRFWRIGWAAWAGNLRLAAWLALALGLAVSVSGPMWTFGVRSRKQGAVVLGAALAMLALLQFT